MTGCASTNQQLAVLAVNCGSAIPPEYRIPVKGVSLLAPKSTLGDLGGKLDTQTANLDKVNGRVSDVISIVDACDTRNKEIVKLITPKKKWFFQ